ncbi:MAG: hypothetical protein ABL866_14170 [Devosia sp.]
MASLSITAANVLAGSNAQIEHGTAGATITAGVVVYRDSSDGKYKVADADSATAEAKNPRGIALNGASSGQPLAIIRKGDVTIGATMVAGLAYYLSPTPGEIGVVADVLSGDDPIILGQAKSTTVLTVDIQDPGVTL